MKTEHDKHEHQTGIFVPPSTTSRKKSARGSSITNMVDDFITSTKADSWENFLGPK